MLIDLASHRPKRGKKGKEAKKDDKTDTDKEGGNGGDSTAAGATPKPGQAADKKKKRKIRLDMHLDQVFLDTSDAYVWLYDPIPWYYWVGGTAIVLGECIHRTPAHGFGLEMWGTCSNINPKLHKMQFLCPF